MVVKPVSYTHLDVYKRQVQKNGVDAKNFEYRVAKNDKPYFVLKAANHQEIGRSQYYSSQAAAEKGVESVINNASSAVIKEVSE